MEDWIQLTEEDIERAYRLTRERAPMPEVIIIAPEEAVEESAAAESPSATPAAPVLAAPVRITHADLTPASPLPEPLADMGPLEQLMYELLCRARLEHLPGWLRTATPAWHDGLAAIARGHSLDMLRRQYVAHVSPEGVTAAQRLEGHGIHYLACGENIGVVYGRASHGEQGIHEVHNAFLNQPRSLSNHRGNLLNPIWTHVGVGVAYNEQGALVVTQNFISAPIARWRSR